MTHDFDDLLSATDLSANLSAILEEARAGREFTVTRHGVPVAALGPPRKAPAEADLAAAVRENAAAYEPAGVPAALKEPETALVRLLGSDSVRRILSLFLRDPDATFYQREIARRSQTGLRSAQLALDRLERLGLVASTRDGNRRYYRAVRSPRFEEIRGVFSRDLGIVGVIAHHLAGLDKPVELAFIFGSIAAGDDTVSSDIDLLVVTEASDDELVRPIAEAQRELGRQIDLVSYRPEEFAKRRSEGNHFIRATLAQPRIDVVGRLDDA
jgi:prevent-host-death family protein